MPATSSLRLTGATVLWNGTLRARPVAIVGGRLADRADVPEVDLGGYLVLPGIVDLQSDALGRYAAGPGKDLAAAFQAVDADAAAAGVTTTWLTQGWSWEGGWRGPDAAEAALAALESHRGHGLTDIRLQLRCETHMPDSADRLLAALRRHAVDQVVFSNRLPEIQDLHRRTPRALVRHAAAIGVRAAVLADAAKRAQARAAEVPRHLCRLAGAFDTLRVVYGSHGDPDGETRERFSMIGARLAERPASRRAAAIAGATGDAVVLSAADQLPAGCGRVADMVRAGLCDALVSAGRPETLAATAWHLVTTGVLTLPQAWALISTAPARILRLDDRGRIGEGLRADLTIVNALTRRVEATISAGRVVWQTGEVQRRFLAVDPVRTLAAE